MEIWNSVDAIRRITGFVDAGGDEIYYETAGEPGTEAVVFCHGLGGNHTSWYQQVPAFAADHFVVTWDQRGFGRSTNRHGRTDTETAAADLVLLLDHLRLERAHLVGQSMGGWTTMGLALKHPGRVRSLTLSGTIAGVYTPEVEAEFDRVLKIAASGEINLEKMPVGVHPGIGQHLTTTDPAQAFLYQQLTSLGPPPPAEIPIQLRAAQFSLDAVNALHVPVLMIVGIDDPIFSLKAVRIVAQQIPNSRLVEVQGSGHSPYFELPEEWNATVRAFLREAVERDKS